MDPSRSTRISARLKQYGLLCLSCCAGFLVLLTCLLGGVYQAFQSITLRTLAQLNREFSVQTDTISELVQTTVRSYGMQVFYTPAVSRLRESHSLTNSERVYGLREFNTYVSSSEFVDSISVYNQNTRYVYTTDSSILSAPVDEYADRQAAEFFLEKNMENWMRPIRRTVKDPFSDRNREFYSFLFFETDRRGTPHGNALMINVPSHWYEEQLLGFDQEGSHVLLDENGKLIAAREEALATKAALFWYDIATADAQEHDPSYLIRKIGREQTVCLYSRMESTGWYCMRILPLDQCLAGLPGLRDRIVAWLSFGFTLLALLSASLLFFIYFPFRRMSLALRRAGGGAGGLEADERLTALVERSIELRQSQELADLLEEEGRPPASPPALPVILLLAEAAPQDALRQFVQRDCPGALVTHQSGCGVALLPRTEELEALALCGELASRFSCRCYYSTPRAALSDLPDCYRALKELQQLRLWYPGQRILSEKKLGPRNSPSGFSEKDLNHLAAALRSGELDRARAFWKDILDSLRDDRFRDQRFAFNRVGQLMRELLAEAGLPFGWDQVPLAERLEELEDIGILCARFDAVFVSLAAHSADQRQRRFDGIAAQVAHRIEVGFDDFNLSAAKIADEMGLSSAYLGKMFRQSYNIAISEYINRTRVGQARVLLETEAMSVETIAAKVGFENTKYFYVVFKNIVGQTPLQYRKAQKAGGSEGSAAETTSA